MSFLKYPFTCLVFYESSTTCNWKSKSTVCFTHDYDYNYILKSPRKLSKRYLSIFRLNVMGKLLKQDCCKCSMHQCLPANHYQEHAWIEQVGLLAHGSEGECTPQRAEGTWEWRWRKRTYGITCSRRFSVGLEGISGSGAILWLF